MANDFYTRNADFNPDEIADGDAIEAEFDAVQRGFDEVDTAKQDQSDKLSALVGLAWSANQLPYISGANAMALTPISAFVRSILNSADATKFKTAIGAQPFNELLTALAGLTTSADKLAYFTGADSVSQTTLTEFARSLIDDADAATMRATLGLGNAATKTVGSFAGNVADGNLAVQGGNSSRTSYEAASADSLSKSGFYSIDPAAISNPYPGTWGELIHLEHFQQNNYGFQLLSPVSVSSFLKMRKKNNNVYSAWKNVWTEDSLAYETGTFTPYVFGSTTAGAATYSAAGGRYTRIGNRVFFHITLIWTGHTGTGVLRIGGLPFTSQNTANNIPTCSAVLASNIVFDGTLVAVIANGSSNMYMRCTKSGVAYVDVAMTAAGTLTFSGSYEI